METWLLISNLLLWALVIFQSLVMLGVVRTVYSNAETHPEGTSTSGFSGRLIGEEVPAFSAVDLAGQRFDQTQVTGTLTAMLFVSTTCVSCSTTLAELHGLQAKANGRVVIVCRAGHDDCARLRESYDVDAPVLVDEDLEISRLFDVTAVPTAVLIAGNRIQSYGNPMRSSEVEEMLDSAHEEHQLVPS